MYKTIERLCTPPDAGEIFVSTNAEDPRLGNLVTPLTELKEPAPVRCAIIGVPQHIGVERNGGRPGAAAGPSAIRRSLYKMATSAVQHAFERKHIKLADCGNIDCEGKTLEQIHDEVHDVVRFLLQENIVPIVLGGGHDTAWPSLMAHGTIGKPFGIINIDAHADVRPLIDQSRAHSGSPFRQVLEYHGSLIPPGAMVEYGLQETAVAASHLQYLRQHKASVFMLGEARERTTARLAIGKAGVAERIHLSLDMDVFASAFSPGVSAPSADGLYPEQVAFLVRSTAQSGYLKSFDVVETCPPFDVDNRTAKLAATMIMQVVIGLAQ